MATTTTANKLSTCKQCTEVFTEGSDRIGCEGFCNDVFHSACVKLSHEELICYRQVANFWWLCDQCSDRMHKHRSDRAKLMLESDAQANTAKTEEITRIDDEIVKLKEEISSIHHSLAHITRIETSAESSSGCRPIAESSLLSTSETQFGSSSVGCRVDEVEERSPNGRFWLFLTRIKNNVTEQQILKLVHYSLGADDFVIKKLVPVWKDLRSMPFISFKVGIPVRLKETALMSSTWPNGLCFREFRDYVWEPLELRTGLA